jgi:hypothetical protein
LKLDFLYQADAAGASGYVTLPVQDVMEIQASAAVPVNGGHGKARAEKFRHHNIFSFESAESHVVGSYSERDEAYGTLSSVTVEGLNILNVVTCDRIVARLTGKHPKNRAEPSFIPLGSRFENLRIAGHPIGVELATDLFTEHNTWSKMKTAHAKDKKVKAEIQKLSHYKPKDQSFPEADGMAAVTLARYDDKLPGGLRWDGRGIYVPHFGTVYLAEYFMTHNSRKLLMLHVDLGCSVEGCYGGGGVGGNGGWPPTG